MNKTALIELMLAAWPFAREKIDDATRATYMFVVKDIPLDHLQVVVQQLITEPREFPPPPGVVADRYRQLFGTPVDIEAEAATQWAVVRAAIREVGHVGKPTFANPTTAAVVKTMGWRDLCLSEEGGNDMVRFVRFYTALLRASRNETLLTPQFKALREMIVKLQLEDKHGNAIPAGDEEG